MRLEALHSADSELTDDTLVSLIGRGEAERGLRELERRYERKVYHFVLGLLRDTHLATDVTAEVFEKVFLKTSLYQPGTNFRAWLFEVARNQALSALRLQRRTPKPVSSLAQAMPGLEEDEDWLAAVADDPTHHRTAEEREFMTAFRVAVAELPDNYRLVFELCVQQGLSYEVAARKVKIPVGTVAIRIMRARQRLFRALSRHVDRIRRPPACFQD
ncbi:MAG: sigma-70 family RNA polymerase sigma factor [Planctomycetota bacterium]